MRRNINSPILTHEEVLDSSTKIVVRMTVQFRQLISNHSFIVVSAKSLIVSCLKKKSKILKKIQKMRERSLPIGMILSMSIMIFSDAMRRVFYRSEFHRIIAA